MGDSLQAADVMLSTNREYVAVHAKLLGGGSSGLYPEFR
jgi:hypothetical protein